MMHHARSAVTFDNHCLIDVNDKLSSLIEKMDWLADRVTLLEHAVQDTHLETKSNFKMIQAQLEDAKRTRQMMSVEDAVTCRSPLPEYLAEELALLSDRSCSMRSNRSTATSAAASPDDETRRKRRDCTLTLAHVNEKLRHYSH